MVGPNFKVKEQVPAQGLVEGLLRFANTTAAATAQLQAHVHVHLGEDNLLLLFLKDSQFDRGACPACHRMGNSR